MARELNLALAGAVGVPGPEGFNATNSTANLFSPSLVDPAGALVGNASLSVVWPAPSPALRRALAAWLTRPTGSRALAGLALFHNPPPGLGCNGSFVFTFLPGSNSSLDGCDTRDLLPTGVLAVTSPDGSPAATARAPEGSVVHAVLPACSAPIPRADNSTIAAAHCRVTLTVTRSASNTEVMGKFNPASAPGRLSYYLNWLYVDPPASPAGTFSRRFGLAKPVSDTFIGGLCLTSRNTVGHVAIC